MTDQRVETLHPWLRARAYAWLSICNDILLPLLFPGLIVRITVGARAAAAQVAAFAAGLSNVKDGWHQRGLAFDFAVIDTKQTPQKDDDVFIVDGSHPAYAACGNVAVSLECHYPIYLGANQTKPDADHIEGHPGFTMAQFDAAIAAGQDLFA